MMKETTALLRQIPQVDALLGTQGAQTMSKEYTAGLVAQALREVLEQVRTNLLQGTGTLPDEEALLQRCKAQLESLFCTAKPVVINATGVLLHTNLGRAPMARRAAEAAKQVAQNYSSLEYDLAGGCRGDRQKHVEKLLQELLDAPGALVVNNNAAAVLLMLMAVAKGREVVVSRGELVEIGGSFRVPEIMAQSGCLLREVGTTNKTKLADYQQAIGEETAALLKVHCSNYKIVGFTESVPVAQLAQTAKDAGLPLLYDLGSGALLPLAPMGLHNEPGPREALQDGANLVCFSGDKLLGGPQAGIVVGDAELISRMKHHPLMRALRPDKMTLAALEATLQLLRDPGLAKRDIPLYAMLSATTDALYHQAEALRDMLTEDVKTEIIQTEAQVGGGSTPGQMLPSIGLAVRPPQGAVDALCFKLRTGTVPVIGRVQHGSLVLDMRTVREEELVPLATAVNAALAMQEEIHA